MVAREPPRWGGFGSVAAGGRGSFERDGVRDCVLCVGRRVYA